MNPPLPAMHILPKSIIEYSGIRYLTPLYRTSVRGSVLSKTGHSSNFVTTVLLASSQPESYWIMNGTALLMQITN
jgi:dynein heavy chain